MSATTIAKPIKHTKIGFNTKKEYREFVEYAFGEMKSDKKTDEIKEMIKNHKRARKME